MSEFREERKIPIGIHQIIFVENPLITYIFYLQLVLILVNTSQFRAVNMPKKSKLGEASLFYLRSCS